MGRFIKSSKDVITGMLLLALAAMFALLTQELPMGTAIRMGPGYFPLLLAGLLGLLGLIVLLTGLTFQAAGTARPKMAAREADEKVSPVPWRALILVTLAVVVFGLGVRPLGLGPSIGLSVFISALASQKFHLRTALVLTALMVVFAWAVFIKGLGLPLPMLGPWLGGY